MNAPIAPELFDILLDYAAKIKAGKIKPSRRVASTSPALTFCENFYAQFFQNVVGQEIKGFNSDNKKLAIRARLQMKEKGGAVTVIRLITWFEKLCEIYPNVIAIGYGGGSVIVFVNFHKEYLVVLLDRIATWAASESYPEIEQRAAQSQTDLQAALESVTK
jgi:hypothetical protein